MTAQQKQEALQNALISFELDSKYFIQTANKGSNVRFAVASKSETGSLNIHSRFMSYDEFNAYLSGWKAAKTGKV